MQAPPLAVFFVYVWPEAVSSAAGVRTKELMQILQENGWQCAAISPSRESPFRAELEASGIQCFTCDPNDSDSSDSTFQGINPALVVFDRFVMEEQFGWRAREAWPEALHLVDTQDLHSLRRGREALLKAGASEERILNPEPSDLGEDLLRELASLYRADAALVVSSWEKTFLVEKLSFPQEKLLCLPFSTQVEPYFPSFSERIGFCFLGNFRHAPNLDSIRYLIHELWPDIRKLLPKAELHLYGAYPPAEISRWQGQQGIHAHGPVREHRAALRKHRVLLAPLRFGAGIKGKILEAWGNGTPVLGSALALEGMGPAGRLAGDGSDFVMQAAELHENEGAWMQEQKAGIQVAKEQFSRAMVAELFLSFLQRAQAQLPLARKNNWMGKILQHQQNNATKYFSRWIEAKNSFPPRQI